MTVTVVQVGTKTIADGVVGSSAACSFSVLPTPGNAVVALAVTWSNTDPIPNTNVDAVTDNQGNSYVTSQAKGDDTDPTVSIVIRVIAVAACAVSVASAGAYTCTHTIGTPGPAGSYYVMCNVEVSGLASATPDASAVVEDLNDTTTTTTIGPSGSTTVADAVQFSLLTGASGVNPWTATKPAAQTSAFQEVNATLHAVGAASYLILSAIGTQTAVWTNTATASNRPRAGLLVVYKGANIVVSSLPSLGPGTYQPPMAGLF